MADKNSKLEHTHLRLKADARKVLRNVTKFDAKSAKLDEHKNATFSSIVAPSSFFAFSQCRDTFLPH